MRLIIHIGAHKTASTHLQNRLEASKARLRADGVAFYGPAALRVDPPLSSLIGWPGRWPEAEAVWREQIDADEAAGIERVVISEENILGSMMPGELVDLDGRLYPQAAPRLVALTALLGRHPSSVALAVREPSSFITSAFGMWIGGGRGVLIEEFLRGADIRGARWSDLALRLLNEAGAPRLSVWRFEDYNRVRHRAVARLVGGERLPLVRTRQRTMIGWSQAAHDAFIARVLAAGPEDSLAEMAQISRREHPRHEGVPGMQVLPPEVRADTAAAYADDFARLCDLPGVRAVT